MLHHRVKCYICDVILFVLRDFYDLPIRKVLAKARYYYNCEVLHLLGVHIRGRIHERVNVSAARPLDDCNEQFLTDTPAAWTLLLSLSVGDLGDFLFLNLSYIEGP